MGTWLSVPPPPPPPVPQPPAMPSQMEHAMETLMFTFHKYAGDKNHLSKEDLRMLMEKEFPGFLEVGGAGSGPGGGGTHSTRGSDPIAPCQDGTPTTPCQEQTPLCRGSGEPVGWAQPRRRGDGP